MDPTELLSRLLDNVAYLRKVDDTLGLERAVSDLPPDELAKVAEAGFELAEQVSDLHLWLSRGGFLPGAWKGDGDGR